jgi:hypothetical protein
MPGMGLWGSLNTLYIAVDICFPAVLDSYVSFRQLQIKEDGLGFTAQSIGCILMDELRLIH